MIRLVALAVVMVEVVVVPVPVFVVGVGVLFPFHFQNRTMLYNIFCDVCKNIDVNFTVEFYECGILFYSF